MLPEPADAFRWTDIAGRSALVCAVLDRCASHFFTGRAWSLGSDGDRPREDSWAEVARAADVPPDHLLRLRQVHGAAVIVHRAGDPLPAGLPEADAIVSDDPAVALAVQAADCVPLLIGDARTGAIAAVHAGWRGLAAGSPVAAVGALERAFGARPGDLVAVAGPSIGACCYEVGEEVRAAFTAPRASWFLREPRRLAANPPMAGVNGGRPGKWFFDGWLATRDLLEGAGVGTVLQAQLCTSSHAGFPSYRRDGRAAGRIAAVIRMRA